MSVKLGNKNIQKLYFGNKQIKKIYKGNDLIYQSAKVLTLLDGQKFNEAIVYELGLNSQSAVEFKFVDGVIEESYIKNASRVNKATDAAFLYAYWSGDNVCLQATDANVEVYANVDSSSMFDNTLIEHVNLEKINFEKTESTNYMFNNMMMLQKVTFDEKCRMQNLESAENMFSNNHNLKIINNIDKFRPVNLMYFSQAFFKDNALEKLELKNWRTPKLKDLASTFYGCQKLIGSWTCCSVPNYVDMAFDGDYEYGFACEDYPGFTINYVSGYSSEATRLVEAKNAYSYVNVGTLLEY